MRQTLAPGFADPSIDSALNFRVLLDAMSRPGNICRVVFGEAENSQGVSTTNFASMAVVLTLADHESPVWLDEELAVDDVKQFIRFHCGAPIVSDQGDAQFGFFSKCPAPEELDRFSLGTPDYPDRSATIIIQVAKLRDGGEIVLSGPGIKSNTRLSVNGPDPEFWNWLRHNNARFPLGVDVILTCGRDLVALPRSVRILEAV